MYTVKNKTILHTKNNNQEVYKKNKVKIILN